MQLVAVAALALTPTGLCLGDADGTLPWKVRGDMQHLRALTQNRVCVVGRKTWTTLPDSFKARTHRPPEFLVLSRSILGYIHKGCVTQARNQEHALGILRARRFVCGTSEVIILGGAQVYREWWPLVDKAIITLIHNDPESDTPLIAPKNPVHWMEVGCKDLAPGLILTNQSEIEAQPGDTHRASILTFERPQVAFAHQALGA